MSILRKPYEISVWEDAWDTNQKKFIEKKICVIGSDKMESQSRVFDPNFTRNVNGVKKLSFKMYKQYIDNVTGEKIDNIFSKLLVNERKVKLKYGTYTNEEGEECDRWYDFIIKNINETSTNYLYTYQLEDALVQELSKNGFNVILDEKIIDKDGVSNVGTVEELATKVLQETDWEVESEVVVETVEEALVYVNLSNVTAYQISDQQTEGDLAYKEGVTPAAIPRDSLSGRALAFYSSCTN